MNFWIFQWLDDSYGHVTRTIILTGSPEYHHHVIRYVTIHIYYVNFHGFVEWLEDIWQTKSKLMFYKYRIEQYNVIDEFRSYNIVAWIYIKIIQLSHTHIHTYRFRIIRYVVRRRQMTIITSDVHLIIEMKHRYITETNKAIHLAKTCVS